MHICSFVAWFLNDKANFECNNCSIGRASDDAAGDCGRDEVNRIIHAFGTDGADDMDLDGVVSVEGEGYI